VEIPLTPAISHAHSMPSLGAARPSLPRGENGEREFLLPEGEG
jgi:hypothetical protein